MCMLNIRRIMLAFAKNGQIKNCQDCIKLVKNLIWISQNKNLISKISILISSYTKPFELCPMPHESQITWIISTYHLDSVFDEFDNMEKTIEDSMRKIQESMKNEEKEIELESAANPGNSNFKSYRIAFKLWTDIEERNLFQSNLKYVKFKGQWSTSCCWS